MIINESDMNIISSDGVAIHATAIRDSGPLRQDETITIIDGVHSSIDFIQKTFKESRRSHSSSDTHRNGDFHFFRTYEEAIRVFKEEPYSIVKFNPTEIQATDILERGNHLSFDVTGDFLDIGRVIEGAPEDFGSLHFGRPRNRRVRIVIALSQTWSMKPEEINHRSERVIRLVDALENANIRTEIIGVYSSKCNHTEVTVKRFDEQLSIEDVAVVTHSDFSRRLMFRITEYSKTYDDGYGRADTFHNNIKVLKSRYNDELSIYIDGDMHMRNIDSRFDDLEKTLEDELTSEVPKLSLIDLTDDSISLHEL